MRLIAQLLIWAHAEVGTVLGCVSRVSVLAT
jgi:hypothetical protein